VGEDATRSPLALEPGHDPSLLRYTSSAEIARDYDEYHSYLARFFETDSAFLDEVLPARGRVVDLGCGTGRHVVRLARRGLEVTGVDLSQHMLAETAVKLRREGLRAELVRADICSRLPFASGAFDAAICMFSTLGLVRTRRLRRKALSEWRRILVPGGLLVLHVHNAWHSLFDSEGRAWLARSLLGSFLPGREFGDKWVKDYCGLECLFLHLFTPGGLRRELARAGYRVEREVLLNESRTGPIQGRLRALRANGIFVVARHAAPH